MKSVGPRTSVGHIGQVSFWEWKNSHEEHSIRLLGDSSGPLLRVP